MLDPEEIFADLISYRKEINATEVHLNYTLKPFRFVLYNPIDVNAKYHIMPCSVIQRTQNNDAIKNLRRTCAVPQNMSVCSHCVNSWNRRFPEVPLDVKTFDLAKFFMLGKYYPEVWYGIDIPPEVNMLGGFLLYRPAAKSEFHFMRCKIVRYDEKINWIKSYRFAEITSGGFELEDGKTHKLHPCRECLTEWDNGIGWKSYSKASDEQKKAIYDCFSIEEFFEHCNNQEHMPDKLSELYELMNNNAVWFGSGVSNDYPKNWEQITDMYRSSHGYHCEHCGLDMAGFPELAITHHINGSHPDVRPENMKVLCVWCHSKQPHHEKSVPLNQYQLNLLRKLRREQDIKISEIP